MVQRGHHFAIVDEVDSILIDEARTPLIISGPPRSRPTSTSRDQPHHPKLKKGAVTQGGKGYEVEHTGRLCRRREGAHGHADRAASSAARSCWASRTSTTRPTWTLVHHVNQALKAHVLFKCDVDYMVKDGQVVIVDEFTGRLMPGRRWSDGLHQAVEAKEGVKIERENQTLATITFQNYFRMYDKLSGMTGYRRYRGRRVRQDLRARGRRHPHQPAFDRASNIPT